MGKQPLKELAQAFQNAHRRLHALAKYFCDERQQLPLELTAVPLAQAKVGFCCNGLTARSHFGIRGTRPSDRLGLCRIL